MGIDPEMLPDTLEGKKTEDRMGLTWSIVSTNCCSCCCTTILLVLLGLKLDVSPEAMPAMILFWPLFLVVFVICCCTLCLLFVVDPDAELPDDNDDESVMTGLRSNKPNGPPQMETTGRVTPIPSTSNVINARSEEDFEAAAPTDVIIDSMDESSVAADTNGSTAPDLMSAATTVGHSPPLRHIVDLSPSNWARYAELQALALVTLGCLTAPWLHGS